MKFTSILISALIAVGLYMIADRLWMWQHMTFSKLAERRY